MVQGRGRNDVVRVPDGTLVKRHGGADGAARAAAAAAALHHAAAHGLEVPAVEAVDGRDLRMAVVREGIGGATLLARAPAEVLALVGDFARRLHAVSPPAGLPGADGAGAADAVWLHGDLCPVNVLVDPGAGLLAVVDWEDSRVGDPLVDLVWTEWLVRTWHEEAVPVLPVLYDAYGHGPPPAADRRAAMATCLVRHRAREATAGRDAWDQHLAVLDDLDLSL